MSEQASRPFVFQGRSELLEVTGARAGDVGELLEGIADAAPASIFYHTHGFILKHRFIAPNHINEFAKWAARELGARALSEKLAGVDPDDFLDIEALRWELVRVLDEYVRESHIVPRIVHGQPFYFLRAWIQTIPTGQTASTLVELRRCMAEADHSAIYYHLVETRRTLKKAGGELAVWIRDDLGRPELADQVAAIDTFMHSLEDLRLRVLEVLDDGGADR